jgi:hypothetical protein
MKGFLARWRVIDPSRIDVADEIDPKVFRDRFPPSWHLVAGPIDVVYDKSAGPLNRRHSISLDVSLADNPSQPGPEDNHKNDQPPQTEAEESSPGT